MDGDRRGITSKNAPEGKSDYVNESMPMVFFNLKEFIIVNLLPQGMSFTGVYVHVRM
jgi:hypothetical protein